MAYLPGDVTDAGKAGVGLAAAQPDIPYPVIQPQTYDVAPGSAAPLAGPGPAAQNEDEAGGG